MMKLFQQTDFKIITKHCTDLIIKLNQNKKKKKEENLKTTLILFDFFSWPNHRNKPKNVFLLLF